MDTIKQILLMILIDVFATMRTATEENGYAILLISFILLYTYFIIDQWYFISIYLIFTL